MRRLAEQRDLSTQEGRTEYARAVAPYLRGLEPLDLENRLQELMIQTGFSRETLLAQIGQAKPPEPAVRTAPPRPETGRPPRSPAEEADGLRAQEVILSLLAAGQLPMDIVSPEDFDDKELGQLCADLSEGRSPAQLVEEQPTDQARSRVSQILLAPPNDSTDQQLQMARQCISRMRSRRLEKEIQAIADSINRLTGSEKASAISRYMALNEQLKQVKTEG